MAMPTSRQIFRLTSSLSPVSILTETPWAWKAAIAGAVESLGGSRKATYPLRIRSRSSSLE